MTRKDYIVIAEGLKAYYHHVTRLQFAVLLVIMTEHLRKHSGNANFDPDRFVTACKPRYINDTERQELDRYYAEFLTKWTQGEPK